MRGRSGNWRALLTPSIAESSAAGSSKAFHRCCATERLRISCAGRMFDFKPKLDTRASAPWAAGARSAASASCACSARCPSGARPQRAPLPEAWGVDCCAVHATPLTGRACPLGGYSGWQSCRPQLSPPDRGPIQQPVGCIQQRGLDGRQVCTAHPWPPRLQGRRVERRRRPRRREPSRPGPGRELQLEGRAELALQQTRRWRAALLS
jgi:hypothetical protein